MTDTIDCPGDPPFVCIGGWLYSQMSTAMMVFPTNRKCPICNPEPKSAALPSVLPSEYEKTG